jgi:hypothetical protein
VLATLTPDKPFRATAAELVSLVIAYGELLGACLESDQESSVHETTISLSRLRERAIADTILLWMMYQGHVEHLQPDETFPTCKRVSSLRFTSTSRFALTPCGMDYANGFLAGVLLPDSEGDFAEVWDSLLLGCLLPGYDKQNRLLLWGRQVLKSFRQPAENQEIVLCSAEELNWPGWFDDPLPRFEGLNPKIRLHNTIKALNRHQTHGLVHFRGDGTGTRIGWVYR